MQLFSLTGVPPERQKVMISGAMITVRELRWKSVTVHTFIQDTDWGRGKDKLKEVS